MRIIMEMGTVMMKTTMKHAFSMVGTAVDTMSIHITAQYVNAQNEEEIEQKPFLISFVNSYIF